MEEVKLNNFIEKLSTDKEITFELYNAIYKIKYLNKKYYIIQNGMNICYEYDKIVTLFKEYVVYGSSLKDNFTNIRIIK